MDMSNKILNDREIEGKHKSKSQKGTGRKRRLDDGEEGSDDEERSDEGTGRMTGNGNGQVGITLRLKSRTTG
jgi:hypothetical protein